ncbi:MAG: phospholipid carrier-dependent glycosyltransferase, partial [Acidobacteriota bacterium]
MKTHFRHLTYALLAGLALLCLLSLIYGVGRLPFLGPDEPRYAEVAREMFASGDWITPQLAAIPWLEKPSLLYWIAALGYAAFGVSEFSARLGVALIASAGAFLLFLFGYKVRSIAFGGM